MRQETYPTQVEMLRQRAEKNFDLNNCIMFNAHLVSMPREPFRSSMTKCVELFAASLNAPPFPNGHKPAIASGPKRRPASERNIECLLANLIVALLMQRDYVRFPSRHEHFTNTPLTTGIVDLVNLAVAKGYLVKKNGFYNQSRPWESRMARIRGTPELYEIVRTCFGEHTQDAIISKPHGLISLRTIQTKRRPTGELTVAGKTRMRTVKLKIEVPRPEWMERLLPQELEDLRDIESMLEQCNKKLDCHDIRWSNPNGKNGNRSLLYPILYAVYTESFKRGGRLYTGRGGHQNLPKAERATITIDGQPTVELDYSGLHIRILYHLKGKEYPVYWDPYLAVIETLGIPLALRADGRMIAALRKDLKVMLLALINGTGSDAQAAARAHRALFYAYVSKKDETKRAELKTECERRAQRWRTIGLWNGNKSDVKLVLGAFDKAHGDIRDAFNTGIGLDLQYIDATIARAVLAEMMLKSECVPTLPVHDSFIVPVTAEGRLRDAMKHMYREVLRLHCHRDQAFDIPIK